MSADLFTQLARTAIEKVEVDTAYGPQIAIADPFAPGPPNPYLQKLKPRIRIYASGSPTPVVMEPYGAPGPSAWPLIRDSLIVGSVVLGAAGILWLINKV